MPESYQLAKPIVLLVELEEVIKEKQMSKRCNTIKKMWSSRMRGWQRI